LDPQMGSASGRERVVRQTPGAGRGLGEGELLRLVDRAPDVVFRYRLLPPGFDFVSSAIARVTGFTPEELYDDPASALKIVHPDDRAIVHDLLAKGTGSVPLVVRWARKDGSYVWVEQRNTPIFNRARELVAIEGIAREIVDPTIKTRPHVRVVGDIRIDFDRARAYVGGREVRLTPSEFRLLVLLSDEPGRLVSRATILEALWNTTHPRGGRTCEVHISKLRSKLEGDLEQQSRIETVRGQGYRLAARRTT
jgi:PAS domain S-box-containing protein